MWKFKSFQTKLTVFKRELAEDGRASFSASYLKTLRGGNSSVEVLFAKIMIKKTDKGLLFDSGSSVHCLNDTLY